MVSSTGTFVSCKDYDDDIDRIDKELTDLKSQIAALQSKIDAGKYITSVDKTDKGLTFTLMMAPAMRLPMESMAKKERRVTAIS